jgi:hypothetical protein
MKKFLLTLALAAGSAHAEFWDGNRLLEKLNSNNYFDQGTALGYIMGVADTGLGVVHCTPPNATAGQLEAMVRNYLTNVPAERHRSADNIVSRILKVTWPCPDRPSGRAL